MSKCDNCPRMGRIPTDCQQLDIRFFEFEELQHDLLDAVKLFYQNDTDLLKRNANEVCITSHIFHYFALLHHEKYSMYHIDPEYNRNGFGAKYYCDDHYAKPDLIIHRRNCNKYNLLYAEFKVKVRNHDNHDKEKIVKFVSNDFGSENGRDVRPYRFRYGVSVLAWEEEIQFLWYRNGETESFSHLVFDTRTWEQIRC